MRIKMQEPVTSQFVYINPITNTVHVFFPVVSGDEISTDNTCRSTEALKEYFEKLIVKELLAYQKALQVDLILLEKKDPRWELKRARLLQIEIYIKAVQSLKQNYLVTVTELLKKPSNLHEIQLRPFAQDFHSTVTHPVFAINRRNNQDGIPLSALFNAMYNIFTTVMFSSINTPRARLLQKVLACFVEGVPLTFNKVQLILREQFNRLFQLDVCFESDFQGHAITKESMDTLMCIDEEIDIREYVPILLNACVPPEVWSSVPVSPFYNFLQEGTDEEKIEKLSIVVQFFLASANVYCKAKSLSHENFGSILDASAELSENLAKRIADAINQGLTVEEEICKFLNEKALEFKLSPLLSDDDSLYIKEKFERMYLTVTATQENPHMDDFKILDKTARGENAHFVSYKGYICGTLANLMKVKSYSDAYFHEASQDFISRPMEIPLKNESVSFFVDVDIKHLILRIDHEEFAILPSEVRAACYQSPVFSTYLFVHDVAKSRQIGAEKLLVNMSASFKQDLLLTAAVFRDYSGRKFHCTAYEYAYWARDYRMCSMLERHMDASTKVKMLSLVEEIDHFGLAYKLREGAYRTRCFELTSLITMLEKYIKGVPTWLLKDEMRSIEGAWRSIGKAQRELPAHMIKEYCRPNFFMEVRDELPMGARFYNSKLSMETSWFKVCKRKEDDDLALIRGQRSTTEGFAVWGRDRIKSEKSCVIDLEKIRQFDNTITAKMLLIRENLKGDARELELVPPVFQV